MSNFFAPFLIGIIVLVITSTDTLGQQKGIYLSSSKYIIPNNKMDLHSPFFSNSGLLLGIFHSDYFKKYRIRKFRFYHFFGVNYWNYKTKSYLAISPDTSGLRRRYSVNNFGFTWASTGGYPISFRKVVFTPNIGMKLRVLLHSNGRISDDYGSLLHKDRGMLGRKENRFRIYDHIGLTFSMVSLEKLIFNIEGQGWITYGVKYGGGDFFRTTETRYPYRSLNLKVCYII